MKKSRSFFKKCPDCKNDVEIFKNGDDWCAYSTDGEYGPHKCEATKNPRELMRSLGFYPCKDCGNTVQLVSIGSQKFKAGPSGNRHNCTESRLHPDSRHWSNDGSYPWEYPIVDGKPVLRKLGADDRGGRRVKPTSTSDFKWTPEIDALLNEALANQPDL